MSNLSFKLPARLAAVLVAITLAGCGGGGGSSSGAAVPPSGDQTPSDSTAATASAETEISVREDIVISFDEAMAPETLKLEGFLADLADKPAWNDDATKLTLSPFEGAWESGIQTLTGRVEDKAGNTTDLDLEFEIRLVFETFQPASVVIGQADFETVETRTVNANRLGEAVGTPSFNEGRLWLPDYDRNRVLGYDGIPEANDASATWVIGQNDFESDWRGTSASELYEPWVGIEHQGRFYVLDRRNNRIAVFDSIPSSPPAVASYVLGQPDFRSRSRNCSESGFDNPNSLQFVDGKMIVADSGNHRVLIWSQTPETSGDTPDIVLGQSNMENCGYNDKDQNGVGDRDTASARTMNQPTGVWSDGERLLVSDTNNNRVLIWNTFPTTSFQPADLVLGQSGFDMTEINDDDQDGILDNPSSRTLRPESGIWSNGLQLLIGDERNNRILLWNEFPTENFQAADIVIGQSNFYNSAGNDDDQDNSNEWPPSARTLYSPSGLTVHRDKLVVLDSLNYRALVFESR
ncbi:hypothetical protein ACXYTJ_00455 [Gilvimarinus sp. F26214L]|uniref:hypothetical protein n=1 Tax=Gilvimarinus sp. DZF01 TaxID=3461371 RepID=UPI004045D857